MSIRPEQLNQVVALYRSILSYRVKYNFNIELHRGLWLIAPVDNNKWIGIILAFGDKVSL